MKKLLVSIFLLISISGVTKSMEYGTSALIGAASATVYSVGYMVLSTDTLKNRLKNSGKWIAIGALMGTYAQASVCMGTTNCSETAVWYAAKVVSWTLSAATAASFHREIHNEPQEDCLSLYN